eukprot:scaffold650_cov249-Pinguiococcus_pyrenoidosus.AAC.12
MAPPADAEPLLQITVWDVRSESCVSTLVGHEHVIESVSFAPGPLPPGLLARREGEEAKDPATAEAEGEEQLHLVSGSRDGTVRVWNATRGSSLFVLRAHDNWVRGVVWHPCLKYVLSCGDDRTLRVYDLKSKRCARTINDAHTHFVTSVAIHSALPLLASGGVDRCTRVWALE